MPLLATAPFVPPTERRRIGRVSKRRWLHGRVKKARLPTALWSCVARRWRRGAAIALLAFLASSFC